MIELGIKPPRISKRLQDKHAFFRADFDTIQTAVREVRMQCLSDRRFCSVTGAQWEGDLEQQFENKPRFEFNKVMKSIIRIFNEYRNQRIDVDFISKDGSDADQIADTCASLYRADEQDSVADEAKDNAFEEGVTGGIGAWRLVDVYADEESESDEMRVAFEAIVDADSSVFHDLDAKRQDKKDAKRCYVLTGLTRQSYVDTYHDDPVSWPKEITQSFFDWFTTDTVYVCEVYEVEKKGELRHIFRSLTGEEQTLTPEDMDDDEKLDELAATGWTEVRQEKTKRRRIHKSIMSGSKILKDCGYITGSLIPVVVFYGKRWFVENVERCMGQVRLAKDAQRLENMQKSKLAEISAFSTVEKPIFAPEQIAGHQQMWANDNVSDYPFLLANALRDLSGNILATGPMAYTKVPNIPPAMVALLQLTQSDMRELMGDEQSAEEVKSNISGKVVELVQGRLDMQAFIYISNFAKSMHYCGEVWISKAKENYSQAGRKMRGLSAQGKAQQIELKRPVFTAKGVEYENDMSKAMLDVAIAIGPSSQSKRAATVRSLTGMMQITQDPQDLKVLTATAMMNMEGEGLSDINEYYRRQLLDMGAAKPTPEEAKELESAAAAKSAQPPDANTQFLLSEAQKSQALADKADADTAVAIANIEKVQSEAAKNYAGIDISKKQQIIDLATSLDEAMQPAGAA